MKDELPLNVMYVCLERILQEAEIRNCIRPTQRSHIRMALGQIERMMEEVCTDKRQATRREYYKKEGERIFEAKQAALKDINVEELMQKIADADGKKSA